jgi:sec-independent protein translocase protein TatB
MLPQFGFTEFLLIAIVALVVVGPRDLPLMLRKFGQWVNKLRSMGRDVQAAFDDLGRQAELDELRREIDLLKQNSFASTKTAIDETDYDLRNVAHLPTPLPAPSQHAAATPLKQQCLSDATETIAADDVIPGLTAPPSTVKG